MNTTTTLSFWTCFFLESGSSSYLVGEKQVFENGTNTASETLHLFSCYCHGMFLLGSHGAGRATYLVLSFFTLVLGVVGIILNGLNIPILQKSFKGRKHFRESLVILSVIELFLSFSTILVTILTVGIKGNRLICYINFKILLKIQNQAQLVYVLIFYRKLEQRKICTEPISDFQDIF